MNYSIFDKTIQCLLKTLSLSSEKRIYRPTNNPITGEEIIEYISHGVRLVNLVPHSYIGGDSLLTDGNILEPSGLSEYFTREIITYDSLSKAIKYTCIKDVPAETEILIFDSGSTHPTTQMECTWLLLTLFVGNNLLKDGSRPKIRYSITDEVINYEIMKASYQISQDFMTFSYSYTTTYFVPRKVKLSAKIYISGNITAGDVIEVSPPIIIGLNQFRDFSAADEEAVDGNYKISFEGTLEEYSVPQTEEQAFSAPSKNKTKGNNSCVAPELEPGSIKHLPRETIEKTE